MIDVKVCGLTDAAAVRAAAEGGARWLGFVFYPPSPRALTPKQAAALVAQAPRRCARVGVLVDPDDALLGEILAEVPLDAAAAPRAASRRSGSRRSRPRPAAR